MKKILNLKCKLKQRNGFRRRFVGGFSLVELSIVLVVIGLIIGAVSIGKDIHRNALNQRIASEFVQGWLLAYDSYVAGTGHVPGDNASAPTGCVNGGTAGSACAIAATPGTALCDDATATALRTRMLEAGIGLPTGRAEGLESRYVYLDSNGLPHELQVCFQSLTWSEDIPAGGYRQVPRNVMTLSGLTPALATFLDQYFDTVVDARFGKFREHSQAALATGNRTAWSRDERHGWGDAVATPRSLDEAQVTELTAWMIMHR